MDRVVLLHGLFHSRIALAVPHLRFRAHGFQPVGISYPSRSRPLEALADHVASRLPDPDEGRIHFFTHSLGGLVVRALIRRHRPPNLGRVVMVSPPNQGSELARRLKRNRFLRRLAGPVGPQLTAPAEEVAELLGPVDFELGIIAGHISRTIAAPLLNGPGDGRVRIDETRIEGMADFLVVPRHHVLIMNDRVVAEQAAHFFRHGIFRR